MEMMSLKAILNKMIAGDLSILNDVKFCTDISYTAMELLNIPWTEQQIGIADCILRISNIAYNNTSTDVLPLDDGLYDQLLVIYKQYDPNYQVGATPTAILEQAQNEFDSKIMCSYVSDDDIQSNIYAEHIWKFNNLNVKPRTMAINTREPITKRLINTEHKYPALVGTLDKCKFVLNNDAQQQGVFDKPSVQVFERDFIHKCLNMGAIQPDQIFAMICELKYDGVSVEAEVCGDTIVSALSRGDTSENIATDLTPIFGGYKFPYATKTPKDFRFGIKFEAVITKVDMDRIGKLRGKTYKNCRNAIIGILGASDAYKYADYITLIPLASSIDISRIAEINYLNRYYNSGEFNRHAIIRGNYQQILFQVKKFVEAAEIIRPVLPYMIDGVVVSFTDPQIKSVLGRVNSVNKYSMAIKFNPRKVRTNFLNYTYSIGKSGDVIPMVHFKPCEFIGGIHTKQTIHSYERFKTLNLAIGEQIDIEYVNDVISYVTKPDTEFNRTLNTKPEEFIKNCPYCGSEIIISESGKSAKCPNPHCHERQIMRMVDMVDRLGFKDIAEETIRSIDLTSFTKLMNIRTPEQVSILGPLTSQAFADYVNDVLSKPIADYRIMSSLSFDGMADEKWKLILKKYSISELFIMSDKEIYDGLLPISGIGDKVIKAIIDGKNLYIDDINFILNNMNIIDSKGMEEKPKIVLTGFRDAEFMNILTDNGFDVSDKYSVTKNTAALITNDINSDSGKIKAAKKYGIPIYTKQSFLEAHNIVI